MEADMEVVAEASSGEEVVPLELANQPDVALLDISAADLRRSLPSCRSLILTTFGRPGFLRRAMDAGALRGSDGPQSASAANRADAARPAEEKGWL